MSLTSISLSRFRNHGETTLDGTARLNLLIGPNGAGKTNVLEALSLLSPGRGLRRAALPDMAQANGNTDGSSGFAIGASLISDGEPVRLGTYTEAAHPSRRKTRINTADAPAIALGEWLAIGWLTPAMDGLFTGSAQDRRRYMDRLALALNPEHARHASRYETALRERNRLLSDEHRPDAKWLDAIEAQLADHGAKLAEGRAALVDAMMAQVVQTSEEPFPRPALTYVAGGPVGFDQLSQALHDGRGQDQAARRTLTGPHRDELDVLYAAKRMPAALCSTGEQKALLLAMTLAHAALAEKGRASLLLLDEVAAHLDPDRRAALFDRLRAGSAQVWMTGTEAAPFADIMNGEAAVWDVKDGGATRR